MKFKPGDIVGFNNDGRVGVVTGPCLAETLAVQVSWEGREPQGEWCICLRQPTMEEIEQYTQRTLAR